jgi:hypothetical protein
MSGQIVRRARYPPITQIGRRALWDFSVQQRNMLRKYVRKQIAKKARSAVQKSTNGRKRRRIPKRTKYFHRIEGLATGPTHTTTRMIVRRTPGKQKFLRKLFKTNPIKTKYVNRFGFSWLGQKEPSQVTWYSICHLKYNNIVKYMQSRMIHADQNTSATSTTATGSTKIGNYPDAFIYVGKCTFTYELYNPSNYIMTVFIYDLVCKRDTPHFIKYNQEGTEKQKSSAPEDCMYKGSLPNYYDNSALNSDWCVGDPTAELGRAEWNSLGMKPTDYHMFNTFWKVKGVRKIVLPPTSSHHHVVVFNPKKKITNGGLFYSHQQWNSGDKKGLGGLTQATLFGFQGQVAAPTSAEGTNDTKIGTLPGKLLISCVKKINIWQPSGMVTAQRIIAETDLITDFSDDHPKIFSDLSSTDPKTAMDTS